MKTLGIILIISGIVISIIGYGMYADFECHCPAQIVGGPFNCHCEESLPQIIGHVITYSGFAITGCGIVFFVMGWRKQDSSTGVGK